MYLLGKYGVQTTFSFPMPKAGSRDLAANADWTPATGDIKISKDGGNVANTTNTPGAVGGTGSVMWTLTLTAAEMTAAVIDIQIVDSATKAVDDQSLKIYTYGNASAKIPIDISDLTRLGLSSLPNAAAEAAGGMFTRGTGAGQVNQEANGYISVNLKAILSTVLTETVGGYLTAAFKKLFDVTTPVLTAQSVNQTGDAFGRLGVPAGASVSVDVAAVKSDTGTWATRVTTLFAGMTSLAQWLGMIAGKQTGNTTARTEIRATGAGSGTFDETTDSEEGFRDSIATAAQVASAVTAQIALSKNVAHDITFTMYLAGTRSKATGKTPTCLASKNRGTPAGLTGSPSITEIGTSGDYGVTIAAADFNCNNLVLEFSAAGCDKATVHIITQQ